MNEKTSLKDKVAIISGGGTGIGRAIALALAQEGARLIVCGRRKEPLDRVVFEIQQTGARGLAVPADVSDPVDVERLVRAALQEFGRIDILVNNAGIFEEAQAHEMAVETWDRVMAINLRAPFLLTRTVLPMMRSQRSGQILNISSESGLFYYDGDAVYGLSKHALNDFSEYIQRENQEYNIRVSTICPGVVVTEMTGDTSGVKLENCLYPDDIADLAVWMLSRRQNIKIGNPILIQTMLDPWK